MQVKPFTDTRSNIQDDDKVSPRQRPQPSSDDTCACRWLVFARAVGDRYYILVRQGRSGFSRRSPVKPARSALFR